MSKTVTESFPIDGMTIEQVAAEVMRCGGITSSARFTAVNMDCQCYPDVPFVEYERPETEEERAQRKQRKRAAKRLRKQRLALGLDPNPSVHVSAEMPQGPQVGPGDVWIQA